MDYLDPGSPPGNHMVFQQTCHPIGGVAVNSDEWYLERRTEQGEEEGVEEGEGVGEGALAVVVVTDLQWIGRVSGH